MVGHNEIDEEHRTFVQLIQQLETCRDAEVLQNLKELISGTETHFAFDDRLMVEMNFPPRDCHMEEHQAVLKSGYEVLDLVFLIENGSLNTLSPRLIDKSLKKQAIPAP